MNWHLSAGGFIVGLLIGLTGMGGGSLMTPMLILVFRVPPAVAIGTDLVYSSITKCVGAVQHIRQKTVDFRVFTYLALSSIPGALGGSWTVAILEHHLSLPVLNQVMNRMLGIVYVIAIVAMVWRMWWNWRGRTARSGVTGFGPPPALKLVCLGLVGSFIVGLTSVGSGSLYVVGLTLMYPLVGRTLVGTDILQGIVVTGVAGLAHLAVGNVDLNLVATLLVGSIPGILIGSRLTTKIPEMAIRTGVIFMLAYSSWTMLAR